MDKEKEREIVVQLKQYTEHVNTENTKKGVRTDERGDCFDVRMKGQKEVRKIQFFKSYLRRTK